jgi:predicted DNA-binding helix-hairpin-helix protein
MELVEEIVKLANRVSSNIELPSDKSLKLLAPNKTKEKVLQPLKFARDIIPQNVKTTFSKSLFS